MKKSIFLVPFAVFVLFAVGFPCRAAETVQVSSGTQSTQYTGDINLEKISDESETGGSYTLNQENTYTGSTTVTAGTLELTHAKGASTGAINVGANGILKLSMSNTDSKNNGIANTVTGAGKLYTQPVSPGSVVTLFNDLSGFTGTIQPLNNYLVFRTADVKQATLNVNGKEVCFVDFQTAAGADTTLGMISGWGTLRPSNQIVTNSPQIWLAVGSIANASGTFSGTIRDQADGVSGKTFSMGIEKVGATSTWKLTGESNSYTLGTKITEGVLEVANSKQHPENEDWTSKALGTGTVTLNGGTLRLSSANMVIPNALNVAVESSVDSTIANSMTLSGKLTGSAKLNFTSSTGQRTSITYNGDGSAFTGTIAVQGSTNSDGGFLTLGETASDLSKALVTLSPTTGSKGNLCFNTDSDAKTYKIGMLTGNGLVRPGAHSKANSVSTLQVGARNESNHEFSGTLQNYVSQDKTVTCPLAVEKVGTGTWKLSGWSNYSGGMTVTGGTLEVNHANALGTGTLTFNGGAVNVLLSATFSNPINVAKDSTLAVNHQNHVIFSGALSGTEDINYTSTSRAVVWFQGDTSNYTGMIKLATAREYFVVLDAAAKNSSTVAFDVAAGSFLSVNALNSPTITDCSLGMLTGSGNFRHYYNAAAGNVALQVGNDTEYTNHTWSGKIFDHNSGFNQTVSLTKAGSNTWTIAGENTYTGSTTVAGGVLELTSTGNLSKTSGVTVLSGAKLLNAGTIAGKVTVEQGGVYEATSSTASTGGLTFKEGGIVQSVIAENGQVIPVDLTSASLLGDFTTQILFEGENPEDLWEKSFDVIRASDESILGKLNVSSMVPGTTFLPSFADGFVRVTAYDNNAIPEPTAWILLLSGMLLLFRRQSAR